MNLQISPPIVNIVLSTFNGARYLNELLSSLVAQENVTIRLIYRDDGSIDDSYLLVEKYFPEAVICNDFPGNIGVAQSYLHLLTHVPEDGLIAFCDQDDIWLNDKCSSAINKILYSGFDLYASRVKILGKNVVFPKSIPTLSLMNSLHENTTIGSTMVFNQRILKIALTIRDVDLLHDELINLISSVFGIAYYDESPKVLYRIHDKNATGIAVQSSNFRARYLDRVMRLFRIRNKIDQRKSVLMQLINSNFLEFEANNELKLIELSKFRRMFVSIKDLTFRNSKIEDFLFKVLWRCGVI